MSYHHDSIRRDGFASAYGRFYTQPGRVERVEAHSRRRRQLDVACSDNFVRGQLKHYGVQFDESEISGNGTLLMKKVLQAGKCDKVPDHISGLREQMYTEWLCKLTPEELSSQPELVIDRYFLSSGRPDHTKTTTVVAIPLPQNSLYRSSQMREAANKVTGLQQATGLGPKTQAIFMGWDSVAVGNAAKSHAAKEAKELHAAENECEDERAEIHTDYLNTLKRKKGPRTYSPVGSYIIDCEEIEGEWPDLADVLSLDIRQTEKYNVFEASFDFGVLEGVMIISAEKHALEQYCSQLDREAESGGDEDEDDWSEEEDEDRKKDEVEDKLENSRKPTTGSKRRAEALRGHAPPPKKSRARAAQPRTYLLKLKCRETGEGVIQYTEEEGTIIFKDENLASFLGNANLPCVGQGVPFTARKISDAPARPRNSWADYSESAYEYARVARWH
ncbi:Uncharacterized protein BP5553_08070 [Venustampulla echinocandica]|uniref:Uncharacterized protein n=1 Tax=Venustampulla echinocandica TaxID=2656787 RepID=A0A370TFM7_9HELO|nr:Uncharacterized protein BP5553_08070 [Venustampulla echinocandica]RDL33702.1 Uncharacterized protein BP5553_08070 [Venustampulla echinocandica]